MKKTLLIVVLILVSYMVYSQQYQNEIPAEYGYKIELGQTVPDFELVLPDGSKTPISNLQGKVVMLQFTASWCGVCRKEMPHIENEIWQKHKDNPGFALYGIDLKEDIETVIEFQNQTGVTYPIALDADGSIFEMFTVPNAGVTRNIIIDKSGEIVFLTRLFKEDEFNQMKVVIEKLLGE